MTGHSPETRYLAKVDPVMRRLIREVGPFALVPRVRRSPFESLARAIAFQQLHEKAAASSSPPSPARSDERAFPVRRSWLSAIWPRRRSMGRCRPAV